MTAQDVVGASVSDFQAVFACVGVFALLAETEGGEPRIDFFHGWIFADDEGLAGEDAQAVR